MRVDVSRHKPLLETVGIIGLSYEWKWRVLVIWVVFWAVRIEIC